MPFTVCLTHDVDRIRKTYQYLTHDIRNGRFSNLKTLFNGKSPYWMFEKIIDIEMKFGVRSTFFFLDETIAFNPLSLSNWKLSLGRYRLSEPKVASKIRELDRGGWEIGLHGSYNSYRDLSLLRREKENLENVLGKKVIGIRQHYLNLDNPDTWIIQRQAGFEYDSSLGLKQDIGFPDGRFHPFTDSQSKMFVIPLAIMECYLFSVSNHDPALIQKNILEMLDQAQKNSALLCVLWHPHLFNDDDFPCYTEAYEYLIQEAKLCGARFMTCAQIHQEYMNDQ